MQGHKCWSRGELTYAFPGRTESSGGWSNRRREFCGLGGRNGSSVCLKFWRVLRNQRGYGWWTGCRVVALAAGRFGMRHLQNRGLLTMIDRTCVTAGAPCVMSVFVAAADMTMHQQASTLEEPLCTKDTSIGGCGCVCFGMRGAMGRYEWWAGAGWLTVSRRARRMGIRIVSCEAGDPFLLRF